jgi:CRP/FNR family transcriptional regulator, cyclic AMP receptor protein
MPMTEFDPGAELTTNPPAKPPARPTSRPPSKRGLSSADKPSLRGYHSFSGLTNVPAPNEVGLDFLAERGIHRRFPSNTVLIHEGDEGDTLFIILSGRVRVYTADNKGKEVTLGITGAGDYVGEMALDGGPRSANVITLEPTVCAIVNRNALREHISTHPDFALVMMARLISRARRATLSVRNLALFDTHQRLVNLLESMAMTREDGVRTLSHRVTHLELAHHVACSREMISRLLKELEAAGYLGYEGSVITILKPLPQQW